MKSPLSRRSRILALAISVALASAAPALAATSTWDGGGNGNQWTDAANWSPNGVPTATTDVVFGAISPGLTIQVSTAAAVNSLTINSTNSFTLEGDFFFNEYLDPGAVTRSAGAAGNQVFFDVALKSNEVWNINGSGSLTATDVREFGGSHSLTKNGSGLLIFDGEGSNYSGGTIVNAGTLELDAFDPAGTGPVTIASGAVLSFKLVPPHNFAVLSTTLNVSGSGINSNGAVRALTDGFVNGHVNLHGNTSVGANSGARLTISGVISDGSSSFTLTKVGAGTVELAAANTYGGNTTVSEGTLTASHDGALGTGAAATVLFGAALNIRDGVTITQNLLLNGSGIGGNGALRNFTGNNTSTGIIVLQSDSTIGCDSGSLTINGVIAGNFSPTKVGAGSLILTNTNIYSGVTNLQEGTIRIRNNGALGSADIFLTGGAALELRETPAPASAPLNVSKTIHLNGGGFANGGALRNISSNNTWAGSVILESASTVGVDADTLTITGATSGAFDLTKVGDGTLILTSNANNHANTIVDGGILGLVNPNAFPIGRAVTVHDGGMAEFQGSIQMARALNLNGAGVNNLGALHSPSGSTGWPLPITLQADSSIGVDAGELRITGAIGGAAALTKVGAGKLTFAGTNNYTGPTNVSSGVLSVESSGGLPSGSTASVSPGAALEVRGVVSIPAALTLNGTGILGAGALHSVAGSNTWTGPITLNTPDASIGVDAGTQLSISGAITDGTSVFPLTKTGAGTLILSSANTYDGGTLINGGTLQISADNNLGAAAGTVTSNNGGKLTVAANTSTSRTFNLNNGSLQVNSGATLTYNNATVNGGFLRGPGTHQINAGSSFNGVTALNGNSIVQSQPTTLANFTNAGSLLSSAALTWDGGFNTPAGNITVNSAFNSQAFENDGIMTINNGGNVTNTASSFVSGAGGRITINPGGQLNAGPSLELGASLLVNNGTVTGTTNVNFLAVAKGSGTYGTVNVNDGGKFSPGNSPGAVTTGSTTWGAGGGYLFEINDAAGTQGVNWDLWNMNGGLNITAGTTTNSKFTVSVASLDASNASGNAANFSSANSYSWLIASTTTGITGFDTAKFAIDTSAFTNPLGGGSFALSQVGNNLFMNFSGVSTPPQWNVDASGSWSTAANWLPPSVPSGPTAIANFLGKITAPRTVTLDGDKQVQQINFDNGNTYTIAPGSGGTLTVGDGTSGGITVTSGSHVITAPLRFAGAISKTGPGALTISGAQSHAAGANLLVSAGQLNLNSNSGTPATGGSAAIGNLSIDLHNSGQVSLGADQDMRELDIFAGDAGPQQFNLNTPAAGGAFRSVRIHTGDLTGVKASLWSALIHAQAPGAADVTDGIFDTGLGFHPNSKIGLAQVADAHGDAMILMRPTRIGDLNLDGSVTISDFIDLASHFGGGGTWQEGDLNYDSQVTISDFIDLASNFGGTYAGDVSPISSVPEPASFLSSIFFAAALGRRSQRRSR